MCSGGTPCSRSSCSRVPASCRMKYGLGMARELRVARFVAPAAQPRRHVRRGSESRRSPATARRRRRPGRSPRRRRASPARYASASRGQSVSFASAIATTCLPSATQALQPGLLVLQPLGADDLRLRVLLLPQPVPVHREEVERGEVLALDEVVQIARRKEEVGRYALHGLVNCDSYDANGFPGALLGYEATVTGRLDGSGHTPDLRSDHRRSFRPARRTSRAAPSTSPLPPPERSKRRTPPSAPSRRARS